jgi:alkylated DNA repair protein (DNA oxidative demethylase)
MRDLFEAPPIPGLRLQPDVMTAAEESQLIAHIEAETLVPFRFQQWTGKRLVKSYGWEYDFQSGAVGQVAPLPGWLLFLRERAARFAAVSPDELEMGLLLKYGAGAGIGWHRDRPIYEQVLGVSLGAPAVMRFRKKAGDRWQRVNVPLEPRSLYHMTGEVRHEWEHSIMEMKEGTRYSITFRTLSAWGRNVTSSQPGAK